MDLQYVINNQGKIILTDFDGYHYAARDGRVYGIESLGQKTWVEFLEDRLVEYDGVPENEIDMFAIENGQIIVRLNGLRQSLSL